MNDQQLLRYSRHILLDEIGIEGQQAMLDAHVLIIGAGGLGSPAALYLAAAGVGTITLVDDDTVDLTNLQRQILHDSSRVGLPKAESGRQSMLALNPGIVVHAVAERAAGERLAELVRAADVVLDCCDNFVTRHAVNRACVAAGVPLVSGAALRFDGQVSVFDSRRGDAVTGSDVRVSGATNFADKVASDRTGDRGGPCYACLFPPDQDFEETLCATMGVFSPLVGIIGAMQAAEALKLLCGIGPSLAGRLLLLDARSMEWSSMRVNRDIECGVCGTKTR
jgi:molybdopterin/thiamine biosynthesis adenylyltransferase